MSFFSNFHWRNVLITLTLDIIRILLKSKVTENVFRALVLKDEASKAKALVLKDNALLLASA